MHIRQTGQIYKASHFMARHLCSKDNFLKNSNICASEGIIGPISDTEHVSTRPIDWMDIDDDLFEDDDWDDEDWDEFDIEEWLPEENIHRKDLTEAVSLKAKSQT